MEMEWNVKCIIDTGILESKQSAFICGSPDGIGRLYAIGSGRTPPENGPRCDVFTAKGVRCAIECKTMSTAHTAKEQELLIGNGLDDVKYIDVVMGDEETVTGAHADFFKYVRSIDHRDQCLYHSVCLNTSYTLYVIGKPGEIIRVVTLNFGTLIRQWYTDVIVYQHRTYLK